MSITVLCPLYKAEGYIDNLHKSLLMQEDVDLKEIKYMLTNTNDGLEKKLEKLEKAKVTMINPEDYSHSLTRERAAMECDTDVIVFISQDIIIEDKHWLKKFVTPIMEGKCEAAFSRQICDNKSIERYTRMNNYPDESRVVSKADIDRLGIMTFFFSDAASAISLKVYKELKAYDEKDLLTNEDMYFAYKLINAGYRIMYNSEAVVIHSHDYKFKELFKRYFDQGAFLADHPYLLQYNANGSAFKLLKLVLKESTKEANFYALFNVVPNFAARFIGNKFGQSYKKLSEEKVMKYSSNKNYWIRRRSV